MAEYKPTIGLEIHAELNTKTKMFCDSLNDPDERHPNINVCPICMGHPGTLPVMNQGAVKKVIQAGLALNCKISEDSFFERKNYFYPDLPKGYQISQYQKPLCREGWLEIKANGLQSTANSLDGRSQSPVSARRIRIERIHLEEDAGRLYHDSPLIGSGRPASLVDFNRAGVPLMELVTEPDLETAQDVKKFAEELQLILKYLGVSDANMEKGQMRVEVNISLARTATDTTRTVADNFPHKSVPSQYKSMSLGTKVEIKNLNSIKAAMQAVEYEIKRQSILLEKGERIVQETRGWDDINSRTVSQRSKEEAHDYRYFPEPDLPPLSLSISEEPQSRGPRLFAHHGLINGSYGSEADPQDKGRKQKQSGKRKGGVSPDIIDIDALYASLPELPQQRRVRFAHEYGLLEHDIDVFTVAKPLGDYFEKVISELSVWDNLSHLKRPPPEHQKKLLKLAANYLITELQKLIYESGLGVEEINNLLITPENFAEFVVRVHNQEVSSSGAQALLKEMYYSGLEPETIIRDKNLKQVSDLGELEIAVKEVMIQNPKATDDFKQGKQGVLKFLIGQIMRQTQGKANPQLAEEVLKKLLTK